MNQHITTPSESLRLHRSDVPTQVETLVCDLLAKTPDKRPSHARVVRARIGAAQAALGLAGARTVPVRSAAAPVAEADPATQATLSIETLPAGPNTRSRTPTTKRRRWTIAAIAAAAAIALAGAATIVPMLRADVGYVARLWTGSSTSAATSPAPAAVATATPAPSLRTAPSDAPPSATPPPRTRPAQTGTTTRPAPRTDPITALRQAIDQQVTAGGLKAHTANDLNHMVDDLAKTITTGSAGEVTDKINALRAKLTTLNSQRKLSGDAYRVLSTAVDQVAADQG